MRGGGIQLGVVIGLIGAPGTAVLVSIGLLLGGVAWARRRWAERVLRRPPVVTRYAKKPRLR